MTPARDFILIAGLWLTGRVWEPVAAELTRLGHRPVVPSLPGVDDGGVTATLDDQLAAVSAAVAAAERPVVIGHSAAATLAWLAADRRPDDVARVVMIGGFPGADGTSYADFFPVVDELMPFPGWAPFEGPDAVDLDEPARRRFTDAAVPVPAGVARGTVRLGDERRHAVPVTMICPEYSPDDARAWLAAGELPELEQADVSFIDIDSGHWPMITRPLELALILDALPTRADEVAYTIQPLSTATWEVFAELVERNNGVYGGCWCIGYHPPRPPGLDDREAKLERVRTDAAHAALVLDEDGRAQGWAQYGDPDELAGFKHRREYDKDAPPRPDWRITCIFVDPRQRKQGVARAALGGALGLIADSGGGRVEAISEATAGRQAQPRFLFSATVELFEEHGFTRGRQVGKHAWLVSRVVDPSWTHGLRTDPEAVRQPVRRPRTCCP